MFLKVLLLKFQVKARVVKYNDEYEDYLNELISEINHDSYRIDYEFQADIANVKNGFIDATDNVIWELESILNDLRVQVILFFPKKFFKTSLKTLSTFLS